MLKRSLSRGTSIVAALALVGILSIVLLFTQILLPNVNSNSQSAQAATPLPTARPAAAGSSANQVSEQCQTEQKAAAAAAGQTPALNQKFTSNTTESNKCIAAIYDEGLAAAVKAKSPNADPKKDPNSYKCVGEVTKVTISDKGQGDIASTPGDTNSTEGICKTTFCDSDGKCSPVQDKTGGQTLQSWAIAPSTATTLPSAALQGAAVLAPIDTQTQSDLDNAFSQQQKSIDDQIKLQNAQIDVAQEQLDELARSCGEGSTSDPACTAATQTAQQNLNNQQAYLDDLNAKNAELKSQTDALANATSQDLTDTGASTCTVGTASVGCDKTTGEVYASSEEKAAVEQAGYTCSSDSSGGSEYSYSCTKNSTTPDNKTPANNTFNNPGNQQNQQNPANNKTNTNNNTGGGIGSAIQSFLGGLLKGISSAAAPAAAAAACSSDPTAYAAQQQQYQTQLQQYQYQMQQYQYQQQQMAYQQQVSGYVSYTQPTMPVAPAACTPTAASNTCAATPAQPAGGCPAGTTIQPVTSNQSSGVSCTTGWQCVPSNGSGSATVPTAQLSCQPQVADVGMSVSLSFGCTNATGSSGSGFNSLGATSGSSSTVITAPPAGVNTATFGITCINQNLTGQASCSVQVSKPSIVLLANPKVVSTSTASTIGWVTSGMSSCVVSSPQQADFTAANANNTSVNGMATTSPITEDTDILLHCVTLGGGTRDATTTISAGGAGTGGQTGNVTVSSSADGASIARGTKNTIQWSTTNAPSGSKMSLWLYDVRLNTVTGLIASDLDASGSYDWTLPTTADACSPDLDFACASDLAPGRTYGIEADLYTGDDSDPTYTAQGYSPAVFTISQ